MEPILFIGGVIVVAGGIWTVIDLLQDAGITLSLAHKKTSKPKPVRQRGAHKIQTRILSC